MSLWGRYQRWAAEFPDESRWLPWIWGVFALFLAAVGWSLTREWRASHSEASAVATVAATASRPLTELRSRAQSGAWGPADADTLDLAFAAVQAGERHNSELERGLWNLALSGCGHDPARVAVLKRLGQELKLQPEVAQADAYLRGPSANPPPPR